MRKLYTLGIAFAAVFAFSVVAATTASAKEWLWNGEPVTELLGAVTEGELLLEDTKASIRVDVLCSGKFVGSVGPNGEDEITLVESLTGEDEKFDCVAHEICNSGLATVTVLHIKLGWHSQIELMANGEILDVLSGNTEGEPGYKVECATFFGTFSDSCVAEKTTHEQTVLTNGPTDVLGEFSETASITPLGECTMGGKEAGAVVGTGLTFTPEGGTLSVS